MINRIVIQGSRLSGTSRWSQPPGSTSWWAATRLEIDAAGRDQPRADWPGQRPLGRGGTQPLLVQPADRVRLLRCSRGRSDSPGARDRHRVVPQRGEPGRPHPARRLQLPRRRRSRRAHPRQAVNRYAQEFADYLADPARPDIIPVEYYEVDWQDFAGAILHRRPKGLGVSFIDSRTIRSSWGVDYHTREMLGDFVEAKERAAISVAHRSARHKGLLHE